MGDGHTLAELKAINNALDGTLTLNDYTALSGSAADIKAALAGTFTTYTGNVTINDADSNVAAADITTIEAATNGTVTVSNNINLTGTFRCNSNSSWKCRYLQWNPNSNIK